MICWATSVISCDDPTKTVWEGFLSACQILKNSDHRSHHALCSKQLALCDFTWKDELRWHLLIFEVWSFREHSYQQSNWIDRNSKRNSIYIGNKFSFPSKLSVLSLHRIAQTRVIWLNLHFNLSRWCSTLESRRHWNRTVSSDYQLFSRQLVAITNRWEKFKWHSKYPSIDCKGSFSEATSKLVLWTWKRSCNSSRRKAFI